MGRACTVVCRNRSSPTITPVCAGLDEKSPCMHTSFGEQSIGCSESNALTPAISRHLLESSNMPDKAQLLKSPILAGILRGKCQNTNPGYCRFINEKSSGTDSIARPFRYFVYSELLFLLCAEINL